MSYRYLLLCVLMLGVVNTSNGTYVPNSISVTPAGHVLPCGQLQYTIHFENLGADTAHDITVLDTLSDNIDTAGFNLVSASATIIVTVFNDGVHNIVGFYFPGIDLPDISHPGLNEGTIVFTINANNSLPDGTSIDNMAGIYFDTNPVVTTNTVSTLVGIDPVTGADSVCAGSAVTLNDISLGGAWSCSNSNATISASGMLTGVSAGTDTITYSISNSCASRNTTKIITITDVPPTSPVTGTNTVCTGSITTLTDATTGGIWSSGDTATATINSSGTVTGVTAGVVTMTYTVSNGCGDATATYDMTINPLPVAGTISGATTVCEAATTTLTPSISGGTWAASNSNATVSAGTVTGVTAGAVTMTYTISNGCGDAFATYDMTVNPLPVAGTISGATTVCEAATTILTPSFSGGTWSASNTNATVSDGTITGVTAGTTTISYTVTNICGTATATKAVTINPLPDPGTISGPMYVCPGGTITLTASVTGGYWHASNFNATISTSGVVTGVTAGVDIMSYSFTNSCGTASATSVVIVNPIPTAGSISGATSVCVGSNTTLTNSVSGGIWSATNSHATIITTTPGGYVTGVTAGLDTIIYTITTSCGTSLTNYLMTINPLPVAGAIGGAPSVCEAATTSLSPTIAGGTWSASNGDATILAGAVTGVSAGIDTMTYTVTNVCGSATAIHVMTVNPLPVAGAISGSASAVCVGASITLSDPAPGGVWTASNTHATVSGGVVTGVSGGTVTISYTVTNGCGVEGTSYDVTVNPLPAPGAINGFATVCAGSAITLSDSTSGGSWSASNTHVTISGGVVNALSPGTVTISYTVTNSCGTLAATRVITVVPLPNAGTIAGDATVCIGDTILLTDASPGGIWSHDNGNATVAGGIVTGIAAGTVHISYSVTNGCGTDVTSVAIIVKPCHVEVTQVNTNSEPLIFPNPATEQLSVITEPGSYHSLTITNSIGETVLQASVTGAETTVSINALIPGVYYIKLAGNNGSVTRKFVKL